MRKLFAPTMPILVVGMDESLGLGRVPLFANDESWDSRRNRGASGKLRGVNLGRVSRVPSTKIVSRESWETTGGLRIGGSKEGRGKGGRVEVVVEEVVVVTSRLKSSRSF